MLREIFAFLGFQFEPSGFVRAVEATDQVKAKAIQATDSFGGLAAGVKGFLAILAEGAILSFANTIAEEAFEVGKLSEQLGLSTRELQAWELGGKRVGVSASDLSIAFRKLSKDLAGGAGGGETKAAAGLFARLGIDPKDDEGKAKKLGAILPEIAEKISKMSNETEKVALTMGIFGRSGERLLPILNKGAAGVAELTAEFDKLGRGFSDEAIKRSQEYLYSTYKLHAAFDSFKSLLAVSVLPMITKVVDKTQEGVLAFTKFSNETTLASNGVEILAAVLAGQLALALAPYLGTGLKFAAIYLAVDDLLAFLDGKDSVIGDLLNRAFGDGTATQVRSWVSDAKDSFGGWLEGFKVVVPDISAAFSVEFAKVGAAWDSMILSFETTWNEFVGKVTGFTGLQFSEETLANRKNKLTQDAANVGAAQNRKNKTAEAVSNFASATTALSGQGAAPATGPLRAPIITQNFVELKPNLSITVPPGTSKEHSMRLVREAAEGFAVTERRAAGLSLSQRGGN